MVIAAVEARLSLVLDLTQPMVLRTLREPLARLRREDWQRAQDQGREALTQAIGRAAFEEGLEALLAPSAAVEDAVNIVVFPARLGPDSFLRARGLEQAGPQPEA
jgi:hypothetical protein